MKRRCLAIVMLLAATGSTSAIEQEAKSNGNTLIPMCADAIKVMNGDTPNSRFAAYLDEHPEQLHLLDTQLVVDALEAAFPCQ